MKQLQDFLIDFNRNLTVTYQNILHQGAIIPYINNFKVTSRLDFHDDFLIFKIEYNKLSFTGEIITYNVEKHFPDCPIYLLQPPSISESVEGNIAFIELHLNTKDILLGLFSNKKRSFKLSISYVQNKKYYSTSFTATLPIIDNQQKWTNRKLNDEVFVEASNEMFRSPVNQKKMLENYFPDSMCPVLVDLFKSGFKFNKDWSQEMIQLDNEILSYRSADLYTKFHSFDYLEMFKRMLCIEDLNIQKTINKEYSLKYQQIIKYNASSIKNQEIFNHLLRRHICDDEVSGILQESYAIQAPAKLPNDIDNYDIILVTNMDDYKKYKNNLEHLRQYSFIASIDYIFGRYIVFNGKNQTIPFNAIRNDCSYHIEFCPNRMTIRTAQRALETIKDNQLSDYFKSFDLPDCPNNNRDTNSKFYQLNWRNQKIIDNEEQKQAVENILNETAFPSPYIVIGPPGTGKTTTIIEAIVQIIQSKPNARVLLTSNTNSNCDELGIRLLEYVSCNKVLRLYSTRVDECFDKIPTVLKPISNYRMENLCACQSMTCIKKHQFDNPSYEEFYSARVVIATLCSSGRFVTAGIQSNHFDYIFIDEAASHAEPYTLIPIAGLGSSFNQITANIVLCGDPSQLGPIITDPYNKELSLNISMMERLMVTNRYQHRDDDGIQINSSFVTQLINNFRSNYHLLRFSNSRFYDSYLKAKLPDEIANFAIDWKLLRNPKIPILMHHTLKQCYHVGTSFINDQEVGIVNYYVNSLINEGINNQKVNQKDIGIISPYRAQRENLILIFHENFPDIEIGTIDSFQGREKKIIIISTVRSGNMNAGFLADEKRLNVAITRAQCLLIVIGNLYTLSQCTVWDDFLMFCTSLNVIIRNAKDYKINNNYYDSIKESV